MEEENPTYFPKYFEFFRQHEIIQPKRMAHIYTITAAFCMSLEMLFVKSLPSNKSPFHLALIRSMIALAINSQIISAFRIPLCEETRGAFFRHLVIRGILGFFVLSGFYLSFFYISLSEGMVLILMTPIWTFILGRALLKESFAIKDIFLCFLSLYGVYLILNSKYPENEVTSENKNQLLGAFLALGTGILRAFNSLLVKSLSNSVSIPTINQFHFLVSILCCSLLLMFLANLNEFLVWEYFLIGLAAMTGVLAQTLGVRALSLENPGIVNSLQYCSVIFGLLFDTLLFSSYLGWQALFGCIFIAISTISIILRKN